MTDLELLLQRAFDSAGADNPVAADPWPRQQELLNDRRSRPPRQRTWLWVGLTIAAACLVLLTVLVIVPAATRKGQTPPAQPSPVPAPTGPATPEEQFTRTYLRKCLSPPELATAAQHDPRVSPKGAIVRLVGTDQFGRVAVITTPTAMAGCEIDKQGGWHVTGFIRYIPGMERQIEADYSEEINFAGRPPGVPRTEGRDYNLILGRVASNVAGVDWVLAGRAIVHATVGNGVFVLRVPVSVGPGGQPVAYDISGRVVFDQNTRWPVNPPIPWP